MTESSNVEVRHFAYQYLVNAVQVILQKEGMSESASRVEAELMVEADLQGVPSHGVRMLPGLVAGLRSGQVAADPQIRIVRKFGAICAWDGGRGAGRFLSAMAIDKAVDLARKFGIGSVLVTNISHWGRAHAYAARAAAAGCIGCCATNAMSNMIAYESKEPVLGNDPIGIGVPRGGGLPPVVLDMAMSQAAIGKIGTYRREGRPVPAGWGLDAGGNPTSDPDAIMAGGRILPMGDHKGTGLAIMMELLTGALAAGQLCFELAASDSSGLDTGSSKFFVAINPDAFTERAQFEERVESLIDHLHRSGGPSALFPGERGWQARARHMSEGVPVHVAIVAELERFGIG
jgi:LDH2 family malate/lactate/ureidoglycolate dehydrogenase